MVSSIQNPMEKAHICRPGWSTKTSAPQRSVVLHIFICNALFGPMLQVLVDCLAVTIEPYGLRV